MKFKTLFLSLILASSFVVAFNSYASWHERCDPNLDIFCKDTSHYGLGWKYAIGIGWIYAHGDTIVKDDKQAVEWYKKLASQGYAIVQHDLGWMYAKGIGVKQNDTQAVYWYRKAANQGIAKAQYNLGLMYAHGKGVAQDFTQAVYWYRKAANQGSVRSQEALDYIKTKQ